MRATVLSRPEGCTRTIARADGAAGDGAGKAAEVEVGAIDPLHRQAEGRALHQAVIDLHRLEVAHQRGAVVPGHRSARRGDVVAP